MADPISLVASLVTLLSTGIKLSKTIIQTIDSIRNPPKHIKAISADLKGLYHVLGTLYGAMSSDDTRRGVMHPAASDGLETTLSNTIEVFVEITKLVNKFAEANNSNNMNKWAGMKSMWKAEEVERWSRRLADQKLTLNVAISTANLINTGNLSATTARAAEEIREQKRSLTELLLGMEHIRNIHTEQNVVVANYRSTIRSLAMDTASLSSVPSLKTPDSPDMAVSTIVSTEASTVFYSISTAASVVETMTSDENSAFITAPSLRSSSTYLSAPVSISGNTYAGATDSDGQLQPSRNSQNHEAVISASSLTRQDQIGRMDRSPGYDQRFVGTLQIFVKGLSPRTQAIQLEAQTSYFEFLQLLSDRVSMPPDRISMYYNGRRLTDTLNLPNNVTLQASVNAYAVETVETGEYRDTEGPYMYDPDNPYMLRRGKLRKRSIMSGWFPDQDLRELRYSYARLHRPGSLASTGTTRSLGSYYREEMSTQQRYAGYLKSLFQEKFQKRSIADGTSSFS